MRFSSIRPSLLIFFAIWLLEEPALASAADENAYGKLMVSMTILPSCEVRASSEMPFGIASAANKALLYDAIVSCPTAYPFRISLTYGAATSLGKSNGDDGLVFTGAHRIDLSQFFRAANRGKTNGIAMLTISY